VSKKAGQRWYLREWRKHRGLTQDQLADRASLSKPYISQLERGEREYNQHLLEHLAEVLRCEPADLIMRDPTAPDPIWSLWETVQTLAPAEQMQAVELIKVLKRTGTDG
jgi:transcriptional regulator with XRE-family HTH domain